MKAHDGISTGPEEWLGVHAVAVRLGVVDRTVYRLIDHGDLPAYRIGRLIRVRRQDLDGFLAENRVAPGSMSHLYPG